MFNFVNTVTPSDIISCISMILVIIGGIFTYIQWKNTLKLKRADYINDLTEKIRTDNDIKEIIYIFDYTSDWYSASFHGSGELERKIDKTLSYFSYICYLKHQHIISKVEFKFFEYEIDRMLMNRQVQDYFYNLYHFSEKFNTPITFEYLFEYGRKKFFDSDFYDKTAYKKSNKYHKYLNFYKFQYKKCHMGVRTKSWT